MVSTSRLALFSEKFIQACWLLALIVAPLFFNIYSSRVFEPDKTALIRTLALAMAAMWLVLRAERWRRRNPPRAAPMTARARFFLWAKELSRENPLTFPALLLMVAHVVSTILSVSPTVSFFGSYQRLQGLYTFSSYLLIFFLTASVIKNRGDIERAASIALVASFPIALYGVIQHYFVDPLPWVGDVTSRVASNLGNSIFIGAFLILTIPLAAARLIQANEHATQRLAQRGRLFVGAAVAATLLVVTAAWGLTFDLVAKPAIEASYGGVVTPNQLQLASGAFSFALASTFLVIILWVGAALLLKQRITGYVLIVLYSTLLAIQLVALLFSQSRGPQFGFLGGLFVFAVLLALVGGGKRRVAGKATLGGLVVLVIVLVGALLVGVIGLINVPGSPLSQMRDLPYVGRLGRVFEVEGGTGRVRVLIWQGALQLIVPHEPLSSPLTGDDAFNAIRPLIGYGPETMYVAYNKFYPPELGTLESRNATPDRSHNETFDALVTTGLFGFVAENLLFLTIFYLALKWLGLIPSIRGRNLFVALWFGIGVVAAVVFGLALGWEYIGVALPGGMMLGMLLYLVAVALRGQTPIDLGSPKTLWLIALFALFVSHFIEIHFGIAILSTRVYFWFFAAVFVVIGAGKQMEGETTLPKQDATEATEAIQAQDTSATRRKRAGATQNSSAARKPAVTVRRVSTSPLITFAFLVGFALAVMGYDYINTNNLTASGGQTISWLDIIISALTIKGTTAGGMTSFAMLWLFITTLVLGLGFGVGEWGKNLQISRQDWAVAILMFLVLAFAVFSGLVFYHVLLIAAPGAAILDALLAAVALFTVFMLLVAAVCAATLMFDETIPNAWVSRTTNWVVAPVLIIVAGLLIHATNVEPIRADILYKQAVSLTGQNNSASIELFQRALALQPQQDYYYLFLGKAYLEAGKQATNGAEQTQDLQKAEEALKRARAINPYNTDHSANLARLAQARGALGTDPGARIESYKQSAAFFQQALQLSPNTAHLYVQFAQSLMEFAQVLEENKDAAGAAAQLELAKQQLETALDIDSTFCFSYSVRAQTRTNWQERTADALEAIRNAPRCGDVFYAEGLSIAVNELARASDESLQANEGAAFEQIVAAAAQANPTLEIYTTLANFYSKAGRIPEAIAAVDHALAQIPATDTATTQRYKDFRFTLVELQSALDAVNASPNNPELQRTLAQQWIVRGQFNFALPVLKRVIELKPDDYSAHRNIALVLIATDQLEEAVQQVKRAEELAPQNEHEFWQRLSSVVQNIQSGNADAAVSQLDELAKAADKNDFALVSALRKLAENLKGAG